MSEDVAGNLKQHYEGYLYRLLVDAAIGYAIFTLNTQGRISTWNSGAKRLLGYEENEILGKQGAIVFTPEDRAEGVPEKEMETAQSTGQASDDRWHIRKDGSRFFASGLMFPLRNSEGKLEGYAKILRDTTEHKIAEEETNYLANHDQLTGLPNRLSFMTRLHYELARAKRYKQRLAVLLLDLNRFKYINDTMGHDAGDLLLQEVAKRLQGCIRETDLVARIGGDEFVIIQTGLRRVEDAGILAQKIVNEMALPLPIAGSAVHSGASIGITIYPRDASDVSQLLKNADIAMYRAKSLKQDGFEYFTKELGLQVDERKNLEDRLRSSLDAEEMEIYFQPQVDLTSWTITAVEALLRWKNPDMQSIPVSDLFNVAEESGSIVQIGKWVLQAICRQMKQWHTSDLPVFHVSMNVSPLQFNGPDFLETVRKNFEEYGIQPGWLEMEITERALVENAAGSSSILEQLKSMGVLISVDDFGTGYSALSYLRRFPIDFIKIDLSLIEHLPNSQEDVTIVTSILDLARNLGLKVIAEGVETTEQLAFLAAHGCSAAQGYLFHPPITAGELTALMKEDNRSHMNPLKTIR